jgi:hypothetical protein
MPITWASPYRLHLPMDYYHDQTLADALDHLTRVVSALEQADGSLLDAGVPQDGRSGIRECRMLIFELESWIRNEITHTQLHMRDTELEPLGVPALDAGEPVAATPVSAEPVWPAPAAPPLAAVVNLLFGEAGVAELEAPGGRIVALRLERWGGDVLTASAGRMTAEAGTTLVGRIIDRDGVPWRVLLAAQTADERDARTVLTLRIVDLVLDELRAFARLNIGGTATLQVVRGRKMTPGEEARGHITSLSETGCAFTTNAPLRKGDRLLFHGRFFAEEVNADLRVTSLRPDEAAGGQLVGCWFIDIDADSRAAIARVLAHAHEKSAPVTYSDLRSLPLEHDAGQPPGRLHRLLRRRTHAA